VTTNLNRTQISVQAAGHRHHEAKDMNTSPVLAQAAN
jgi:hypothetical protein